MHLQHLEQYREIFTCSVSEPVVCHASSQFIKQYVFSKSPCALPAHCKVKCVNMPLRLLKQDLMEIVTDPGPTIRSILGSKEKRGWQSILMEFFTESYFQGRFVRSEIANSESRILALSSHSVRRPSATIVTSYPYLIFVIFSPWPLFLAKILSTQ